MVHVACTGIGPSAFAFSRSTERNPNARRLIASTHRQSNPQQQLAIEREWLDFPTLYSYPRQRGGGIAIEPGKSSYLCWNVQPLATINEPPGLGVELDFKQLTQIAEITEPVTARAQTYFRPDGSITNW